MKRIFGIIVGLSLGWTAAGYVFANPAPTESASHAQVQSQHGSTEALAVEKITAGAVEGAPWLPGVLIVATGLFGAGLFVTLMGWAQPLPTDQDDVAGHDEQH